MEIRFKVWIFFCVGLFKMIEIWPQTHVRISNRPNILRMNGLKLTKNNAYAAEYLRN